jgi:hypothetical protein
VEKLPGSSEEKEYGEKEALAVVLSTCFDTSEETAATNLSDALSRGNKDAKKAVREILQVLRGSLRLAPPAEHRKLMVAAGEYVRLRLKERDELAAALNHPAFKNSVMLRIARLLYADRKVLQVFVPLVSDYMIEYEEAKSEGECKALLVQVTHWHRFAKACGLDVALSGLDVIRRIVGFFS